MALRDPVMGKIYTEHGAAFRRAAQEEPAALHWRGTKGRR